MEIRPIHTEADHKAALRQLSAYFDNEPEPGTPEGDRFEVLLTLERLGEPVAIRLKILFGKKAGIPVVAALHQMHGQAGQMGAAGQGCLSLPKERSIHKAFRGRYQYSPARPQCHFPQKPLETHCRT